MGLLVSQANPVGGVGVPPGPASSCPAFSFVTPPLLYPDGFICNASKTSAITKQEN